MVVGGGPAGCASAITAAHAGLDVVLVDKAQFPRDKTCGDGLTAMALAELADLGVSVAECASQFEPGYAMLRSPAGRLARLPLENKIAAVVTRAELDFALIEAARSAGVAVLEGVGLEDIGFTDGGLKELGDGGCQARLSNKTTIAANHVIAADGVYSSVRKALAQNTTHQNPSTKYLGEWHAARQYRRVATATRTTARTAASPKQVSGGGARDLWVWFEPDLLPGYAWSFPLADDIVNFGFCALRPTAAGNEAGDEAGNKASGTGKQMAQIWRGLAERSHIAEVLSQSEPCGNQRAWPIPARRIGEMPLTCGPVLFCGDAAAMADPMTGEGIGQALKAGRLAAQAIAAGFSNTGFSNAGSGSDEYAAIARRYERSVRSAIGADHRLAQMLSSVLAKPAVANLAVRCADTNDWARRKFGRWMFEAYPRALVATPSRWNTLSRWKLRRSR